MGVNRYEGCISKAGEPWWATQIVPLMLAVVNLGRKSVMLDLCRMTEHQIENLVTKGEESETNNTCVHQQSVSDYQLDVKNGEAMIRNWKEIVGIKNA